MVQDIQHIHVQNLIDLLETQAQKKPNDILYRFLPDDGSKTQILSYGELAKRAKAIAVELAKNAIIGDRVLLVYPPGLELIAAYFGCLYAGMVAVPFYPPLNTKLVEKLQRIVVDAQPSLIMSTEKIAKKIKKLKLFKYLSKLPGGQFLTQKYFLAVNKLLAWDFEKFYWLVTDKLSLKQEKKWQKPLINRDHLAFLQYTSGSTDWPKGVMISHGNLLHNLQLIGEGFAVQGNDRCVGWLPPYHDMGLIGNILAPLYLGIESILFSPMNFLQHPFLWLKTISDYQASISGAPNFAYDYCARKITDQQCTTLNLQSWQLAFNGAEPIHPESLKRFATRFKSCGFNEKAFYPCYGLAEATLFVTGVKRGTGFQSSSYCANNLKRHQATDVDMDAIEKKTLINCGVFAQNIAIVNQKTHHKCPNGEIGEIWIQGASVAKGYWGNVAATQEVFQAQLQNEPGINYLRTGDLGFIKNNNLYVTGRIKDLIIIHGANHYPQDIEYTLANCHSQIRVNGCVAFSIMIEDEEHLAVVCEVEKQAQAEDYAQICAEIGRAIAEHHELAIHTIALIKLKSLPKTTSGKLRRRYTRNLLLNHELSLVYEWNIHKNKVVQVQETALQTFTNNENKLLAIYRETFEQTTIALQDNFFSLGGDSLTAMQLVSRIRETWKVDIDPHLFFEDPSVAKIANMIEDSLQVTSNAVDTEDSISIVARDLKIPLSFSQQRLWFLDQLHPQQAFYNLSAVLQINGLLDKIALEKALQTLVDRHEILRTVFPQEAGQPCQHIMPSAPYHLVEKKFIDQLQLQNFIQTEMSAGFNLSIGSLFRTYLLSTAKNSQQFTLLLVIHHIIADGWSLAIFTKELSQLYNAYVQDQVGPLHPLTIQYADYSQWQRNLRQKIIAQQLAFWKEQLQDAPVLLALATDKPRPALASYQGANLYLQLSPEIVQPLKSLAKSQGCSLYMVLLTIFSVLLYRYTQQADLIIGTAAANRQQPEVKNLIGFFANTLALRIKIPEQTTSFLQQLSQTRSTVLNALANQEVPFEQVVQELAIPRNLSMNPLIQVMFILQNNNKPVLDLIHFKTEFNTQTVMAKFDLTLECSEENQGLNCRWEYSTDLFTAATIAAMAQHFSILAENILQFPEQDILKVNFLTDKELQTLNQWNMTEKTGQHTATISQLFEAQVEKTPERIALVVAENLLSYQLLNEHANQLAGYLQDNYALQADELVALCCDRNANMVIAILAILKAGAAYIPIDPDYPQERISYILKESQAKLLLIASQQRNKLTAVINDQQLALPITMLDATDFQQQLATYSKSNRIARSNSQHLACVIYTSGTTGQPKGVMIEHRNIVNFIEGLNFSHDQALRATFTSPYMFDVCNFDLWSNLCFGHSLFMVDNEQLTSPQRFDQFIKRHAINKIYLPASLLQIHKEILQNNPTIKQLLTGVEPLSQNNLEALRDIEHIINGYGPTECTTCSTLYEVKTENLSQAARLIPIGKPLANTQVYVLDKQLNRMPIGAVGELYIGGAGLARGYLQQPQLTAERFIVNPFQTEGAESNRLYKTGDLVRYLADGNLEFIARNDLQVKVRGFRIELSEIENQLRAYPGIKQAVVLVRKQGINEILVGYYVAVKEVNNHDLRNYLQQKLPAYMLPNQLLAIQELPLTSNGKLNHQALPTLLPQPADYAAAKNPLQAKLMTIWSEVLNLKDLGIYDNFFEIGGHSLIAIQLLQEVGRHFGRFLSVSSLFTHPTIASFSELLLANPTEILTSFEKNNCLVPLKPSGNRRPLFIIHPAGGHLFAYQTLGQNLPADQPLYGLQQLKPAHSIAAMAREYILAIRQVQSSGPYHLLGWSMGGVIAHEMVYQLEQAGESIGLLGLIDSYYSIRTRIMPDLALSSSALDAVYLQQLCADFWRSRGRDCPLEQQLAGNNLREQLEQVLQAAKADQLLNVETTVEQLFEALQLFYQNVQLLENFCPKKVTSDLLVFAATEKLPGKKQYYASNWQTYTSGVVRAYDLQGDHYRLLQIPAVVSLVHCLESHLQAIANAEAVKIEISKG